MLTVALVATLAAAALWQQWRAIEVETAERQRLQAGWILTGALDWSRLILREDARGGRSRGNVDHLGEPWAVPLEEARLSSFLAVDKNNTDNDALQAFLSGEVIDQQSRLNFMNVVRTTRTAPGAGTGTGTASGPGTGPGTGPSSGSTVELSEDDVASFLRLYQLLDLPAAELNAAVEALLNTSRLAADDPMPSRSALIPKRLSQLSWLGLSHASLVALEPHVTVLPERTQLNVNTASAQALSASVPGLDLAMAQQMVALRERDPFTSVRDARRVVPGVADRLTDETHSVRSRFFEVRGRLRLDDTVIEERSLVVRNGLNVRVLWRERMARP